MISWITNMRVYNFMKSFMTKRVNSILVHKNMGRLINEYIMISWITNMRVYNFMKSFMTKRVNSILVNLRYLRFTLLKYKENQKICNTFDHKFKNIPFIMRKVLFCIIQWCPYF